VFIRFGTSKDALTSQTQPDNFGTTHNVSIDPKLLLPGTTYYYVIVSKDQQGNTTQSEVHSFTTKGLTLTVIIFDKNHKPLAHKQVTLHSKPQTATTDVNGSVTFQNVVPGDHQVIYQQGSQTFTQPISVANNVQTSGTTQTALPQSMAVIYSVVQPSNNAATIGIVAALLVVVVAVWLLVVRPRMRLAPKSVALASTPAVRSDSVPVANASPLDVVSAPQKPQPGSTVAPNQDDQQPPVPPRGAA
jgi:hypothetical protein